MDHVRRVIVKCVSPTTVYTTTTTTTLQCPMPIHGGGLMRSISCPIGWRTLHVHDITVILRSTFFCQEQEYC
jgi:hypothetical protein